MFTIGNNTKYILEADAIARFPDIRTIANSLASFGRQSSGVRSADRTCFSRVRHCRRCRVRSYISCVLCLAVPRVCTVSVCTSPPFRCGESDLIAAHFCGKSCAVRVKVQNTQTQPAHVRCDAKVRMNFAISRRHYVVHKYMCTFMCVCV